MLADRAKVFISAGAGGDGCMSFRREAHVPKGGPDGGDGGEGGDVVLVCDDSLRDLRQFRRQAHYRAQRGGHGQGALRYGASGEPLLLKVPPGTIVERWDSTRYDLTKPGESVTVARGGQGGRGNKHFANSVRQAPRLSERGLPGEEGWIELRLKLLADVGLVGLPNAGKSSLLARLTRARPKVGDYPFTTLQPVLGTLQVGDRQIVIADIPGLIEGASQGTGLGHDFLAHIERTQLIVHVLSLGPDNESGHSSAPDTERFAIIEHELAEHDPRLSELPRILVLSKRDLVTDEEVDAALTRWRKRLGEVPVIAVSSVNHVGLNELVRELSYRVVREEPSEVQEEDRLADFAVLRPQPAVNFTIDRIGDGDFRVSGESVERLIAQFDIGNEEALSYIEERLERMGVIAALERAGFQSGDHVEIAGTVFELNPES